MGNSNEINSDTEASRAATSVTYDPTPMTTKQLLREIESVKELVFTRLDAMDKAMSLFNENITRVPTDTDKQIQHLKELHEAKLEDLARNYDEQFEGAGRARASLQSLVETRLNGMDKAIELVQLSTNQIPDLVDEKIACATEVQDQKILVQDEKFRVQDEKFGSIATQFRERDTRTEQTSKDSKVAVDAALQAAKEAVGEQNKSSALAIAKSEASTDKRIDQQALLIHQNTKALDDKIDDIKERLTGIEGHTRGAKDSWGYLVAAAGLVATIIGIAAFFAGRM